MAAWTGAGEGGEKRNDLPGVLTRPGRGIGVWARHFGRSGGPVTNTSCERKLVIPILCKHRSMADTGGGNN